MAKCVTFLGCILLVAPLILHECTAAWGTQEDRDLVLKTFNADTDPCTKLSPQLNTEERAAADSVCEKSFNALDAIHENTCVGWALGIAKCRKLIGEEKELCSCELPLEQARKNIRANNHESFRHCAWNFGSRQPQKSGKDTKAEPSRRAKGDAAKESKRTTTTAKESKRTTTTAKRRGSRV